MLSSFLISKLGTRFGLAAAKFLPYLLAVLAIVLAGWLFWNKAYDRGVEHTEQKYQTLIEAERHRQIEANAQALEEARKRQKALEALLDERDAEIEELLLEGSEDPDAARRALGRDSVRRINRIR